MSDQEGVVLRHHARPWPPRLSQRLGREQRKTADRAAGREGALGWVIYPGFMAGPFCRIRGLRVQQLRPLSLYPLRDSVSPYAQWGLALSALAHSALAFGICAGGWGLGSNQVAVVGSPQAGCTDVWAGSGP